MHRLGDMNATSRPLLRTARCKHSPVRNGRRRWHINDGKYVDNQSTHSVAEADGQNESVTCPTVYTHPHPLHVSRMSPQAVDATHTLCSTKMRHVSIQLLQLALTMPVAACRINQISLGKQPAYSKHHHGCSGRLPSHVPCPHAHSYARPYATAFNTHNQPMVTMRGGEAYPYGVQTRNGVTHHPPCRCTT